MSYNLAHQYFYIIPCRQRMSYKYLCDKSRSFYGISNKIEGYVLPLGSTGFIFKGIVLLIVSIYQGNVLGL